MYYLFLKYTFTKYLSKDSKMYIYEVFVQFDWYVKKILNLISNDLINLGKIFFK